MAVTYRNTRTDRVVELEAPDALMDRSKKWQRVEDRPKPAKARKPKPDDAPAGEE